MAERDQQTREALRMACEHAVRRVLERAGNKVVTRARQKDALTASTLAGVPQWAVPGRLGPAVVAALGLSEDALLKDELVDLRRTWDQYISTGQTQALRDAARLVGMDVNTAFAQLDGTFRADREAGWSFLREVLDRNTRAGLVKDPTELVETGQLVPTSGVRAAIAVAGGYNTRTSSGLNSETLLPADPKEHFGQLGTGTTIKGFLEQNGAKVERYRWSHGLSISPFPPHAALDGFEFDDWDDTRLVHAGFPGDLHPGDHSGCNCDAVLVWVPPTPVQVAESHHPVELVDPDAAQQWVVQQMGTKGLTREQSLAVKNWQVANFHQINQFLRQGYVDQVIIGGGGKRLRITSLDQWKRHMALPNGDPERVGGDQEVNVLEHLPEVFRKRALAEDAVLWRGAALPDLVGVDADSLVGSEIVDKGFIATSASRDAVDALGPRLGFEKSGQLVVFEIRTRKGQAFASPEVRGKTGYSEVVLPAGTRFRVIAVVDEQHEVRYEFTRMYKPPKASSTPRQVSQRRIVVEVVE
jgi:hypothetical protein